MRRQRKVVNWNTPEPKRELRPFPWLGDNVLPPRIEPDMLRVGSLWTLYCAMDVHPPMIGYVTHALPYIQPSHSWGGTPPLPKGALAVYMGTERVEESNRGRMLRVNRHVFLINGARYMLVNLGPLEPV